jgi:hypothetical protein
MVKHKTVSEEAIEHICEDYGLETILEMNDIEQQVVIELLIREGLIDLEEFSWETEDDD